ncbi:hypothetical protein CHUAL_002134 [Chamberlinius hualienensis]
MHSVLLCFLLLLGLLSITSASTGWFYANNRRQHDTSVEDGFRSQSGDLQLNRNQKRSHSFVFPDRNERTKKLRTTTTTTTTTTAPVTTTKQTDKPIFAEMNYNTSSSVVQLPPISMIFAMNNITSPDEFKEKLSILAPSTAGRSGQKGVLLRQVPNTSFLERSLSYPFAQSANCNPQPTTVPIKIGNEPFDIYFPSCTRIERCGGCCSHDLLECTPTKKENVTFLVLKTRYLGPPINKFDVSETVPYDIEKHLECQCQCRVKASDCNSFQIYRGNECRCECKNQEELKMCVGDFKIWDPSTCSCRCKEIHECSTGFTFNQDTCKCDAKRVTRMGFGPMFRGF